MEILDIKNEIDEKKLKEIAEGIKNGKLCLFPTETVYGIGSNGLDETAVEKIYEAKKRNKKNPINLLVSDIAMIEKIAQDISPLEYKLMEAFFPGPFTIILKKKSIVPSIVTANSDFVGVRMPSGNIARKLVQLAGIPIAAPSANISGELSGTNLKDVIDEFSTCLDFAIDGGESTIGMESTIVRVMDGIPHILRPGSITPEQIEMVAGNVVLEKANSTFLPSSTMNHYQLNTSCTLVYDEDNHKMVEKILEFSKKYATPIILCCKENVAYYSKRQVIAIASKNNLENYSKNLFSSLRKADSFSPDMILIEGLKKEGLGIAIMDRLENVCQIKI